MEIIEENSRFVLFDADDKEVGILTWIDCGEYFIITHTLVDRTLREQGLAKKLIFESVKKARREGRKVFPMCPFAIREFDNRPEYSDVRQLKLW